MTHPLPRIGTPAHRALEGAGLLTLEDVAHTNREDLMSLHGMGPRALGILDGALREAGIPWTVPSLEG
ncbi:MAG: DNA-binding protein [Nocardioidaceae bacterium]|nr:DNA-binding protein [Nocardioidaceae bacterium]